MNRKWATKLNVSFLIAMLGLPLSAWSTELAEDLTGSLSPTDPAKTKVWVSIDGCDLRKHTVNIGYCKLVNRGVGDRHVETLVDLNEVKAVELASVRSDLLVRFKFEFGRPGAVWLAKDRMLNGSERQLERYVEETGRALAQSDLRSHKSFSRCQNRPASVDKKASLVIVFDHEPERLHEVWELAKQCRAGKTVKIVDNW